MLCVTFFLQLVVKKEKVNRNRVCDYKVIGKHTIGTILEAWSTTQFLMHGLPEEKVTQWKRSTTQFLMHGLVQPSS
jgi:hypothetical protein